MKKEASDELSDILDAFKKVLLAKNEQYGDAIESPTPIFAGSDSGSTYRICVRLDEKLARVANSENLRTDDILDVAGYCILLLRATGVSADTILKQID